MKMTSRRISTLCKQREGFPLFALLLCTFVLLSSVLNAAPQRRYYDEDALSNAREMRDTVDALRHEVSNHETQIQQTEERANNQEATIASLRQQVLDSNQANKDMVKSIASALDGKFSNMEAVNKGLVADMTQLRNHANETSTALAQYKQKIAELEKQLAQQNQNIDNLHATMKTLIEAMETTAKAAPIAAVDTGSGKSYKVKNGDSLEKIARVNNTTVKAIKDLNSLANDKIVVGQTLQIP